MLNKTLERTYIPELQLIRFSEAPLLRNKITRKKCLYTGRSRAFNRICNSSRHKLKEFIRSGNTYGIKKYSW